MRKQATGCSPAERERPVLRMFPEAKKGRFHKKNKLKKVGFREETPKEVHKLFGQREICSERVARTNEKLWRQDAPTQVCLSLNQSI